MHLMKFEDHVDFELLKIGKESYEQGLVLRVEQTFNDRYTIWIADSLDVRIVNVTVSDFYEVFYNHCDCTADRDHKCEHQVTALFAVKDYLKYEQLTWNFDSCKKQLEEELYDIQKRVLVDRLVEIIKINPLITKILFSESELKRVTYKK